MTGRSSHHKQDSFSRSEFSDLFTFDSSGHPRRSRSRVHKSPPVGRPTRPLPVHSLDSYHDMGPRRGLSTNHRRSPDSYKPRPPGLRDHHSRSGSGSRRSRISPRMPPMSPKRPNEKQMPPPYDAAYHLMEDDLDEEFEDALRKRRIKRIVVYAMYAVLALLVILGCSLTGYFLNPRTPTIALHNVSSQEMSEKRFKLLGSKLQFHIDLTYRVQNDNYFDMYIDDISSAVFWPDTKFALGGGRLSGIRVPARRIAEINMPITIRYDVKRGPPPILLGLVESCGLHDAGIGEMNLEVELQSDYRTKMKQSALNTGRQIVTVKCPVRHLANLQIGDGTSGNVGDIVRTLNA